MGLRITCDDEALGCEMPAYSGSGNTRMPMDACVSSMPDRTKG
jgi:hypothetical protein